MASISFTCLCHLISESLGYDCVLSNLDSITRLLKGTPGAREALTVQYEQKKWLGVMENPMEKELVNLALTRIEQDPSQYDEFLTMLRNIEGMDLIVKRLCDHGKVTFHASHEVNGIMFLLQANSPQS